MLSVCTTMAFDYLPYPLFTKEETDEWRLDAMDVHKQRRLSLIARRRTRPNIPR
jgi:hypothetical protein